METDSSEANFWAGDIWGTGWAEGDVKLWCSCHRTSLDPTNLAGNDPSELTEIKASFPGHCSSVSAIHWMHLLRRCHHIEQDVSFQLRVISFWLRERLNCKLCYTDTTNGERNEGLCSERRILVAYHITHYGHCTRCTTYWPFSCLCFQFDWTSKSGLPSFLHLWLNRWVLIFAL